MEYRVELDVYNGPLDLLLYLIKRDELDIYDIPIAQITDSYLGYVNMLRGMKDREGLDINVAGDFLVMAATLMEIKSAMLLPKAAPAEQQDAGRHAAQELTDPRHGAGSATSGIQAAQGFRHAAGAPAATSMRAASRASRP